MSPQNLRVGPELEIETVQMYLVKIRSLWIGVGPHPMTGVPTRKQRGESWVQLEAETGVLHL